MATDAQINANRENAQKSTGPKTPEGKAISSRNAVKPASAGRTCMLYADDGIEYAKIGQQYVADLQPVGILEAALVETIVDNHFQLNRVRAGMEQMCSEFSQGVNIPFEQLLRLENSTAKAAAALRTQQKCRKAEENYGTIIRFENEIEEPYVPKEHGHLPRMIRFVLEEIDLFLYFQKMEADYEAKKVLMAAEADRLAEKAAAKAAEKAKEAEPPPPAEAVIS